MSQSVLRRTPHLGLREESGNVTNNNVTMINARLFLALSTHMPTLKSWAGLGDKLG